MNAMEVCPFIGERGVWVSRENKGEQSSESFVGGYGYTACVRSAKFITAVAVFQIHKDKLRVVAPGSRAARPDPRGPSAARVVHHRARGCRRWLVPS